MNVVSPLPLRACLPKYNEGMACLPKYNVGMAFSSCQRAPKRQNITSIDFIYKGLRKLIQTTVFVVFLRVEHVSSDFPVLTLKYFSASIKLQAIVLLFQMEIIPNQALHF